MVNRLGFFISPFSYNYVSILLQLQEVLDDGLAFRRQHAFRMKLDAMDIIVLVLQAHDALLNKTHRKEHTQYAAPPRRPHSRCCPRHCTALWGVGIECLSTIAILQICALLKLVVANLAHIVVAVRLIAMHLFKLTTEVVSRCHF